MDGLVGVRCVVRTTILALALLSLAAGARADAVATYRGTCPPGLQRSVVGHGSLGCYPRACTGTPQCGEGARCNPIHECWAPRDVGHGPAGLRQDTVIGLCARDGTCAEGECQTRRQCEPTAPTPSWDRATHSFTGRPYRASAFGIALAIGIAAIVLVRRR